MTNNQAFETGREKRHEEQARQSAEIAVTDEQPDLRESPGADNEVELLKEIQRVYSIVDPKDSKTLMKIRKDYASQN